MRRNGETRDRLGSGQYSGRVKRPRNAKGRDNKSMRIEDRYFFTHGMKKSGEGYIRLLWS